MRTLAMLVNQLRNSGPVRVMLEIARNINRSKYRIVIVCLRSDDTTRPMADKFEDIGCEIIRYNYSMLKLELCTRSIARRLEHDLSNNYSNIIVQAHGYHPTLITSKMRLPHTTTIHCIDKEDFIQSKGSLLGHYMVFRFRHNLKKQKYPVVISNYMFSNYFRSCGKRQILIHNGVNFSPLHANINDLKTKLGIIRDKTLIVIPGGIHQRKNNLHTIRQLQKSSVDNFLCIFLGIGNQLDDLKAAVVDDSRFIFAGYHSNIQEYLACADMYISSSLSEGLPLAALEALCMGVPSLLSDIPPHHEIAKTIDVPGVEVFNIRDDSLASKFDRFVKSHFDRNLISEMAIQHFSSETMAKNYDMLFDNIFTDK